MQVCLIYDCLFPHTVGGVERWYRGLAERLVADGHDVDYLTLRQWDRGVDPGFGGVHVRAVGPRLSLYTDSGRRKILPPLVFGLGVFWHLLRHRGRYDAVHTASFPYFSLLAAALVRPLGGYRLVVDWIEAWTIAYWSEYLGRIGGFVGWTVQRLCLKVPQQAFCISELHARRLRNEGYRGELTVQLGVFDGPGDVAGHATPESIVVFAGRFIPEKRVEALVPAVAQARAMLPELRAELYGDGPERARVAEAVAAAGLDGAIRMPGFVSSDQVQHALATALCMVSPSRREGYGLVVVEAASYGTPSIVVEGDDNAAAELVHDGVNGFVAPSAAPHDLANAIYRVYEGGAALRASTARWFVETLPALSLDNSLAVVVGAYASTRS